MNWNSILPPDASILGAYPPHPWVEKTTTDIVPTCPTHLTPVRWAAKHGSANGYWHCDKCAKAEK